MNRAGIVIVTHNSREVIGECLAACLQARPADIVVVDNASADGTPAEVRRHAVRLIANSGNRGFAAAANQGFAALDCPCVLLLNPDVKLETPLEPLLAACLDRGYAAASGQLLGPSGAPQRGFHIRRLPTPAALGLEALGVNALWPGNPVNRRYRCLDLAADQPADVEQPAGAFLMVRRAVWQEVGGFDETFRPLWFEDVDFLRRLRDRGHKVRYEPSARATHLGAHSVGKLPWDTRQEYWYASLLRYSSKHFAPVQSWMVCLGVVLGCAARSLTGIVERRSLKPLAVYGKVVRLALTALRSGEAPGDDN